MWELIRVGTYGWQWSQWQGGFYPEDLPEDWQLDFYANYFRTVLVPQAQWLQWTDEHCEDLVEAVSLDEDVFDSFEAYLEQPPFLFYLSIEQVLSELDLLQFQQVKRALGDYFAGCIESEALKARGSGLYFQVSNLEPAIDGSLGIYPLDLKEPREQGTWAKAFIQQVNAIKGELEQPLNKNFQHRLAMVDLPVFVGQKNHQWRPPLNPEQAKSLKLLLEMLT